ncbi:hypothetical protein ACFOZY_06330 [Chungangia koreensis]|uniref:Uncharacterized protein n=1 Tax=Chungangia koreensis TaxID=752657 RepID=A0ABV8X3U8_9LACT
MESFMIFVAPIIVLLISISAAFYLAPRDRAVVDQEN